MKPKRTFGLLIGAALLLAAGAAAAAQPMDIGKREYEANCAVCHGATGKGEGSYGELLKAKVPDLTQLAKKNNGVFPFARAYEVIDGRQMVKAHGTRDMPIWGSAYAATMDHDEYLTSTEPLVRSRILALIDYLNRLQAK